jgi:hypothetical protein
MPGTKRNITEKISSTNPVNVKVSRQKTKKSKRESDPKENLGLPEGIKFITIVNRKDRCFIPSTKNYFGGFKVSKVLVDTGCSSILLSLEENELIQLTSKFPEPQNYWTIGGSIGVGGGSPVLLITSTSDHEVKLCQDIIEPAPILIKTLRFSLCSDDINQLVNNRVYHSLLSDASRAKLSAYSTITLNRRHHALLGQSVLKLFSCFKHSDIEFYVDSVLHMDSTLRVFFKLTRELHSNLSLPNDFNDWEDDDDLCHDEGEGYGNINDTYDYCS